jgi:hypothetical protein
MDIVSMYMHARIPPLTIFIRVIICKKVGVVGGSSLLCYWDEG